MENYSEAKPTLDINKVCSELTKRKLLEVIEMRLNSNNFKLCVEPGSRKGDNFMGEIYRVSCQDNNNTGNQTSLILKIAPKHMLRREKFRLRQLFLREIIIYDEVLSFFTHFQLSRGVNPSENGFHEFAKCYSSVSENLSESLILEDLKLRKFEMLNHREVPITFEHMSLLMKALGKFHAISFALKDQQPEMFQRFSTSLFEQYWTALESEFGKNYKIVFDGLVTTLCEEKRLDLLEKVEKAAGNDYIAKVYGLVSSAQAEPYAVICHGDLTISNTMFRKDDQGTPIGIQLFDWQFSRYASPVTDLVLYLLCSSTKELRDKHYEDFLKIYHESLSDLLLRLGSDPQKLFPYEALLDQLKKFGIYAIFVAALLIPMLVADVETMPDFNELAEKPDTDETRKGYIFPIWGASKLTFNKQTVDMVHDMDRFGYL